MVKLIFPCKYIGITQGYKNSHKAIDMGWSKKYGGPDHDIISPAAGKITYVKSNYNKTDKNGSSYGNYIKIDHGSGVSTLVAHLKYNSSLVKVGDIVKQGQKIATMGSTGHTTGVHCHYEVRINNERINPLNYTFALKDYIISNNTRNKYKINYLNEEESNMNEEESNTNENTSNTETQDTTEDNKIFEYICTKTGMYKIQLNENEKLVILD